MNESPYSAPQADLTPSDWEVRRQWFKSWAKDRAALWMITSVGWIAFRVPCYMTSARWLAISIASAIGTTVLWELVAWAYRSVRK